MNSARNLVQVEDMVHIWYLLQSFITCMVAIYWVPWNDSMEFHGIIPLNPMKHSTQNDSDLQDDLPGKGRTAELSSGGMTGQSGYEDSNAGTLFSQACPQHRGDSGGRKLAHPRCALCHMLVSRRALNGRHPYMAQCERGAERKRRRLVEAEMKES